MTILGRRNTNGRLRLFDDTLPSALALLSIPLLSLSFSFFFNSHLVSAYSATLTANTNITVNAKPNSDGTGTKINAEEIGVATNCRAGYNLTITGPSDRNLYKDGNSANNTSGQYFTPVDGTSTLANTTNSWGYSLTSNASSSTVFTPLPNTDTYIRTTAQTASETDINDNIPIYYGVSVTNSISPGQYTMSNNNTIVYQLTMNTTCRGYTVAFNANGGTGTMENQDINIGDTTKLTKNSFIAPAKGQSYQDADGTTISADPDRLWTFWGWNTKADGTGDWYKNIEQVTDIADDGETLTLYAQWKQATLADMVEADPLDPDIPVECVISDPDVTQPEGCKFIDHNTMQDMSPEICYNSPKFTAIGTTYGQATLVDTRDGNTRTYTVAKLPDGLCWMTQNLNLGTNTAITLTSDDTDLAEGTTFTLPASNPTDFTTGTGQANINKATVLNDMTVPDYTVNSTTYSGKVSGYYSYAAATADTATYSKGSTAVTTSICPKNWDLPTTAQYYNLRTAGSIANYNNTNATYTGKNAGNEPYYFIYGGYRKAAGNSVNTTYFNNPVTYGYLWTANSSSSYYGRGTYVYSSGLYNSSSATTYYKYYGLGMRCVADTGSANITYHSNNTASTSSIQSVNIGSGTLAASNLFTAESHRQFKEWNTAADGSGTSYAAGTSASSAGLYPGQSLELYAIWNDIWTITFVNTATSATKTKDIVQGQSGTVAPTSSWYRTGYKLKGWDAVTNDGSSGTVVYTNGQSITPTSDMTVYTVWTPSYKITYNGNGATGSTTMSIGHTDVGGGDEINLYAPNYSRSGYGFAGWSFDATAQPGGSAAIYGPNESIIAPIYTGTPSSTASMVLYAVWVPAEANVYMQTWNGCSNMNNGDVIALKDQRDNQVYSVGKLADGNCWMMENLRLDNQYTIGNNINEPSVTNESLSQGYAKSSTYGNFIGLADAESSIDFTGNTVVANSIYYSGTQSGTATINIGTIDDAKYRMPRYNNSNTNSTIEDMGDYGYRENVYSYGNYYTWAAAMANTRYYGFRSDTDEEGNSSEAVGTSICPKSWKLPYGKNTGNGNTSGGFYYLGVHLGATDFNAVSSNKWRRYPNNFVYSGYSNGIYNINRGNQGNYLTSTSRGGYSAFILVFTKNAVSPGTFTLLNPSSSGGGTTASNYYGYSVRCVFEQSNELSP